MLSILDSRIKPVEVSIESSRVVEEPIQNLRDEFTEKNSNWKFKVYMWDNNKRDHRNEQQPIITEYRQRVRIQLQKHALIEERRFKEIAPNRLEQRASPQKPIMTYNRMPRIRWKIMMEIIYDIT